MPVTPQQLIQWKQQQRSIAVLTAWDYAIASILDRAGIDAILVGDSMAMVALGHDTTLPLTLDQIIHHAQAVRRGVKEALLIVDLPFLTYQESVQQAMHSAGRVLQETGAGAVKLEGGYPAIAETVSRLVQAGIPVMGHVGLTPQSVRQTGFRQQGRSTEAGEKILAEAIALEQAGAFAIVLEHIPTELAQTITAQLTIPTIGIGAGAHCDGQVLVTSDMLGLGTWKPKFAKAYLDLNGLITRSVQEYCEEVRSGQFPPDR
ncbi:MAG TPA: 3-methyl-2-oxobutanoate hydroxymethyltransferase [Leptolyngbya sp.]|jgi:3-methyl-2-oxobutanoate hydroxymethyltransferase|nr:3-methyl-2-oxobutanoate hydroxymethyltransferase [Leptolyngbya sp.]